MYEGLHVKYPVFMSDFNEILIFSTELQKYWNINFHEIPSSGSQIVACGRTDMKKLTVFFRNFANAPKNWQHNH
jgi:hypothetical protein